MTRCLTRAMAVAAFCSVLLAGCASAPPEPERPPLPATFTGTLPCADCPGIDYTLELLADGSFVRRADYRGRARIDEVGRWLLSADQQVLVLRGSRGDTERFVREGDERLLRLDTEGRRIKSPHNQALQRRDDLPPLQPRLQLKGLYSPGGDFIECSSARRLPVMDDLGAAQLESGYLAGRGAAGDPLVVEVEARIGERTDAGGELEPALQVLRFIALHADEQCPPPFAALPLRGSQWTVEQLGGVPVIDDEAARAPFLRFGTADTSLNGFTGCNRLLGQYRLEGSSLHFDKLAATRMACPGASLLELTFTDALKASARWNLFGDVLELYDEAGVMLMRLQGQAEGAAQP